MKVINISIEKGGDGKTTTALNLAVGLGMKGLRVLLGEMDPQGNLTKHVLRVAEEMKEETFTKIKSEFDSLESNGIDSITAALQSLDKYTLEDSYSNDMSSVLNEPTVIRDAIYETPFENVSIIPGTHNLSESDMKLKSAVINSTGRLRQALNLVEDEYDVCIIDNPPFTNALTYNSVNACANEGDLVIIPFKVCAGSFQGLSITIKDLIKWLTYAPLKYDFKILPVMVERTRIHKKAVETIRHLFKERVFHQSIRLQGNPVTKASLERNALVHSERSNVAKDYISFVDEVYDYLEGR